MLGLPVHYKIGEKIDPKTFITSELKPHEKRRLKEAVMDVTLEYQIAGEEVPSLINDDYDCQAILFFSIRLSSIKHAGFVGEVIQKLGKPLYVIKMYDHTGVEVYHFAHKRLNLQDRSQIVVEDTVITSPTSKGFADEINTLMEQYAVFSKIKNRTNKLSFYLEMMVKAYIISNTYLWSGSKSLLNSRIWHNTDDIIKLFEKLKQVEQLKREQKSAKTVSATADINSGLKEIYAELENIVEN